jgi:hypothetical protein
VAILVRKRELDFSKIHFSLAGSGNPWGYLSRTRVKILNELHDGLKLDEVAEIVNLPYEELKSELQPLLDSNLIFKTNDQYRPSFLIVDENETKLIYRHASSFGMTLADYMENKYPEIERSYAGLEVSKEYDFKDVAFLFIGGRIVDIHLLGKLVSDTDFMSHAPSRPSPDIPDAHYYFWMIEGETKHLGEYGLDDYDTPWPNWHYFSFGQNLIDGKENSGRKAMESRYSELIESGRVDTPEILSQQLAIPLITKDDSKKWSAVADEHASLLATYFMEKEQSIRNLHSVLKSGKYAPHSLGEFFCWYVHIAYSVTIDHLESRGVLPIPSERYQAAIWYNESSRDGLLAGLD